jgi:hypothetical protein
MPEPCREKVENSEGRSLFLVAFSDSGTKGNENIQTFDEMNSELNRRIDEIAAECSLPGWDGYGANAVTTAAVAEAHAFGETIDSSLTAPEVGAEPDGAVTFE